MAGWFIWWNDKAIGPIDSKHLAHLISRGEMSAHDWLWHHEVGEWREVRTMGLLQTASSLFGDIEEPPRRDHRSFCMEAPSLTSIYLRRLGRQADDFEGILNRQAAAGGKTGPIQTGRSRRPTGAHGVTPQQPPLATE